MEKYISKSALVAEIERQISAIDNCPKITDTQISVLEGDKVVLTKLLSFLDILEVKEVDLEKEFDKYTKDISAQDIKEEPFTQLFECAKHFFELGLNASNPLTWDDIKTIDKLLNQCVDYSNPYQKVLKRFKDLKK